MRARLAVAALATAVLGASDARAEERRLLEGAGGGPGHVRVSVESVRGAKPGWGYAHVVLRNGTRSSQTVRLALEDRFSGFRTGYSAKGTQVLAPGESAVRDVLLPTSVSYASLDVSVDGGQTANLSVDRSSHHAILVLLVGKAHGFGSVAEERVATTDLPSTGTALSSFHAVVVDGADPDLDSGRQEVLRGYVEGGGTLSVENAERLAPGPLRSLRDTSPDPGAGRGRIGLGRWDFSSSSSPPALDATSPTDARLLQPIEVPGVAAVPVRGFFFLILGFAVLNGPVAYVWLRKKRRLAWMLATIPLTGFGCAAAILLYGLLVEGLGTKGAVWSVSVLDQAGGRVATAASRTLYAGVSPDEVRPSPNTILRTGRPDEPDSGSGLLSGSIRVVRSSDEDPPLNLDLDRGAFAGAALPARTPTAFGTISHGPSRARLRLRRRDDGRYDVLADDRFAPFAARGAVVARLPDGRWLSSDETGLVLAETTDTQVELLLDAIRGAIPSRHSVLTSIPTVYRQETTATGSAFVHVDGPGLLFRAWIAETTATPAAGAFYLGRFRSVPFLDALGLDPEWKSEEHVVLGLLGPGDVAE